MALLTAYHQKEGGRRWEVNQARAIRVMVSQLRSDNPFLFRWSGGEDVTVHPLLRRNSTVRPPMILVSKSVMRSLGGPPMSTHSWEIHSMREEDFRLVSG